MELYLALILIGVALLLGILGTFFVMQFVTNGKVKSAEKSSKQIVRDAEIKAENHQERGDRC